jgi:hypothetical protein
MTGQYKDKEKSDAAQKRYMDKLMADPVRWANYKEKRRKYKKKSIKQVMVYQKNRYKILRAEFITSRGGRCEDCLSTDYLIVKNVVNFRNHQGHFAFQAVALLSKERREVILKGCKVLCQSCANNYHAVGAGR